MEAVLRAEMLLWASKLINFNHKMGNGVSLVQ